MGLGLQKQVATYLQNEMSAVLQKGQDQRSPYLFIMFEWRSVSVTPDRTALLPRYIERMLVFTGTTHFKTQLLDVSFEFQYTCIVIRYVTDLLKHDLNPCLSEYQERLMYSLWKRTDLYVLNIKGSNRNGISKDDDLFKHGIDDFAQRIRGRPRKLRSLANWWSLEEAVQGSGWRKRVTGVCSIIH